MITQVEIKNFRNIKSVIYSFNGSTAIIAGKNGLGKSNTLNAINWLITDTLLTDHYGKGENDIMSIIPTNHQKGQHTEVSIWLETGTKFTKYYKRTYNRAGTKINGHKSEFSINDVACDNANTFYKELYTAMQFYPTFNSVKIAENRLFTDPLFALQKLDAKELRNLLVALGCSVTNEELYQLGYSHMKQYEAKYLGKWDVMRKNLKDTKSKLEVQIKEVEAQLQDYANVEEFNENELEKLLARRDELMFQKKNITSGKYTEEIKDLSYKIQNLELQLKNKITMANGELELAMQSCISRRNIALSKLKSLKENATRDLTFQEQSILQEIKSVETSIKYFNDAVARIDKEIEGLKTRAKTNSQTKNDATIKLNVVMGSSYKNYLTCPHCGESFPASESDYERFENNRRDEINRLKKSIESFNSANDELKKEFDQANINKNNAINESNKASTKLKELNDKLAGIRKDLANASNITYDLSELESIDAEITQLNEKRPTIAHSFAEEEKEIANLKHQKTQLELGNTESINIQLLGIEESLYPIETEIEALYVKKSKWAEKQAKQNKYNNILKEFNDNEYLLAQLNEFIQTMISQINKKATEKTGINFVMLEENITNENISEVCYATVDGVPFKDLNTSRKVEVGIKFIERCKLIAENDFGSTYNWLPILVDRLEGVDTIDKIKSLTTEQLICTRVSTEDTITIL